MQIARTELKVALQRPLIGWTEEKVGDRCDSAVRLSDQQTLRSPAVADPETTNHTNQPSSGVSSSLNVIFSCVAPTRYSTCSIVWPRNPQMQTTERLDGGQATPPYGNPVEMGGIGWHFPPMTSWEQAGLKDHLRPSADCNQPAHITSMWTSGRGCERERTLAAAGGSSFSLHESADRSRTDQRALMNVWGL